MREGHLDAGMASFAVERHFNPVAFTHVRRSPEANGRSTEGRRYASGFAGSFVGLFVHFPDVFLVFRDNNDFLLELLFAVISSLHKGFAGGIIFILTGNHDGMQPILSPADILKVSA